MFSVSTIDLRTLEHSALRAFTSRFGLNHEQCIYFHDIVQASEPHLYTADVTFVHLPAPKTPVWRLLRESSGSIPKLRDGATDSTGDAQSHRAHHGFEQKYIPSLATPAATPVQETTSSTQQHTELEQPTATPAITLPQPSVPKDPIPKVEPKPIITLPLAPATFALVPLITPALPELPSLKPKVTDERKLEPSKVATSVSARDWPVDSDVIISDEPLPPSSLFAQPNIVPIVSTEQVSDQMDCTPIPEIADDYGMDTTSDNFTVGTTYGSATSWNLGPWNSISDWAMQAAYTPQAESEDIVFASPPQNAFWRIPGQEPAPFATAPVTHGFVAPPSLFVNSFLRPEPQPPVVVPVPQPWGTSRPNFPESRFPAEPAAPRLPDAPKNKDSWSTHEPADDAHRYGRRPEGPSDVPKVAAQPQRDAVEDFLQSVLRDLDSIPRSLLDPGARNDLHQSPPPRFVEPEEDNTSQRSTSGEGIFASKSTHLESHYGWHNVHGESSTSESNADAAPRDDPPRFEREASEPRNEEEQQPPSIFVQADTYVAPLPTITISRESDLPSHTSPTFERESTEPLDESEQQIPAVFRDVDDEPPAPVFKRESTEPLDESEQQIPAVFRDVDEEPPAPVFKRESTEPLDESEQQIPAVFRDVDEEPPAPVFEREATEPLDESEQQTPALFLPADHDATVPSSTEGQTTISPLSEPLPSPPFQSAQAGSSSSSRITRREDPSRHKRTTRGRGHASAQEAIKAAAMISLNARNGKMGSKAMAAAEIRSQKRAAVVNSRKEQEKPVETQEQKALRERHSRRAALSASLSGSGRPMKSLPRRGYNQAATMGLSVGGTSAVGMTSKWMPSTSDTTPASAGSRRRREIDDEGDRDSERLERSDPPKRQRSDSIDLARSKSRRAFLESYHGSERLERLDPAKRQKRSEPNEEEEDEDDSEDEGDGELTRRHPQQRRGVSFRLPTLPQVHERIARETQEKRNQRVRRTLEKRDRKARRDWERREGYQSQMAAPPASTFRAQPFEAMGIRAFGTGTAGTLFAFGNTSAHVPAPFQRPTTETHSPLVFRSSSQPPSSQHPNNVDVSALSNALGRSPVFPHLPMTETHSHPVFGSPAFVIDPSSSDSTGPSRIPRSVSTQSPSPSGSQQPNNFDLSELSNALGQFGTSPPSRG